VYTISNKLRGAAVAAAIAVSLTACGGGGGGTSALPTTGGTGSNNPIGPQSGQAQMTINIPAKISSGKAQYISAATQSLTVSLNGKSIGEADLTATSANCSALPGGGRSCTASFSGPVGQNTFVVSMYDATGGKGNVLSTGNVVATIQAGAIANVAVTLDGVPATVSAVLGQSTLAVGNPGSVSVTVQAKDSSGNLIIGPGGYSTPITLAISGDTYNTLSLSSTSVTSPGQVVTLAYTGGSNIGSTITPSIGSAAGTAAKFNATGASLTDIQWQDPADNINYTYSYAIQPIPNTQNAAVMLELQQCCWSYNDGIGIVSKSGMQKVYAGDTSDPYNVPAPGSVTYSGMTVVHGMSQSLITWEGEQVDKEIAVDSHGKIYYGAYFQSSSAPSCSGQTMRSGTLGVLDPSTNTTVERVLKGYPMYMQFDPSGNLWFVEDSGTCNNVGLLASGYAVGELTASGALSETEFSSFGMGNEYPDSMTLNSAGTMMYIGDDSTGGLNQIPLPGLSTSVNATPTNSTYMYALAAAPAPDNTLAWFSDNEPGDNYYWGYLQGSKSFASANMVDALFPVQYYYSYGMTYGDGSFWAAGDEYGTGIARFSNVNSGSPVTAYYAMPYPDSDGQDMTGISVGNGFVWGGDDEYGNIDILEYGAPSTGTVTYAAKHHMGMAITRANPNPGPQHLSAMKPRHAAAHRHN
jgi:hypothetical protein